MTAPKRLLITAALCVSLGLGAGSALVIAKEKHDSYAQIYYTAPDTLNGAVTSPEPKCIPNRKATVRKSRPGKDRKLGTDKTANDGWYTVTTPTTITSGAYYAKIAERKINQGTCRPAKSGTTTITGP